MNARLAHRLTGWKIDIVSDTEFAQQEADAAFGGDGGEEGDFSGRCGAVLSNGKRCPNAALPGSRYCGVPAHQELALHEPDDEVNPIVAEAEPELEALADTAEPEAVTEDAAEFGDPDREVFPAGPGDAPVAGDGRDARERRRRAAPGRRRPRRRHPDRARPPPRAARGRRAATSSPIRTCAGCGAQGRPGAAAALPRRARASSSPGAGPGRGVYTCRRLACFERARAHRAFNRTLRADRPASAPSLAAPLHLSTCQAVDRSDREAAEAPETGGAASSSRAAPAAPAPASATARATAPIERGPKTPREVAPPSGPVTVESGVTLRDFSQALGVPMGQIIKMLMEMNSMKTATQTLTDDEVELIAAELEREVTIKHAGEEEGEPESFDDAEESLEAAPAGRHDHGSRRPRQDDAARRDPQDRGRRDRGRRDHPAHRRLPDRDRRPPDHLPRHARPRGVHGDARPRRQGHRHRRARRRGRRQRDAPDARVDLARARGRRADRRRGQQDRPARREPRPRALRPRRPGAQARGVGRDDAGREGLGAGRASTSTSCSRRSCSSPTSSSC